MKLDLDDLHPCGLCGAVVWEPELHAALHSGGDPNQQTPPDELADVLSWLDSLSADEVEDGIAAQIGGLTGGSSRIGDAAIAWFKAALLDLFDSPGQEPDGDGEVTG